MIELQTSVKQDDTTRTRTPKPGYLNLSTIGRSRTLSDPFVKLSDVERKPPDILSDVSETEVYCLSDPSVLVSDRTVALSNVNQSGVRLVC